MNRAVREFERMRRELTDARPGSVLVAQHLAHLMLVQALRLDLSGGAGRHVGWLFALADPRLATAIGAIHAEPGTRWTLPTLATVAGMSRSSFARAYARSEAAADVRHPWSQTAIGRAAEARNTGGGNVTIPLRDQQMHSAGMSIANS